MLKTASDAICNFTRIYSKLHGSSQILKSIKQNPELRRIHQGFYHNVPLGLVTTPIKSFPRLFLRQSRYRHPSQRPHFYLPELEAKPWWPSDNTARILIANLNIITNEFNDIKSEVQSHPQKYLTQEGRWSIFPLIRGRKIEENCRLCPQTTEVVESLPLCDKTIGFVYFSVMEPGTKVKPHCGPINTRIRYHLTLSHDEHAWIRVDAEKRSWKPNECLVFDDSFEHEVQHNGLVSRAVLVVDCWHPGFSALEREWFERLYANLSARDSRSSPH